MTYWSRRIDWPLMMAVATLLTLGVIAVCSAVSPMGVPARFIVKQLTAIGLGCAGLFIVTGLNYQLYRSHPAFLYGATVILLVAVLLFGKEIHGSKSWLAFGPLLFEPTEITCVGFILVLAALLDRPERELSSMKVFAAVFALASVHILLILRQRHLGGTFVYVPVILGMLYFGGVRPLYLISAIFFGGIAIGIPILSIYFSIQPQWFETHPFLGLIAASARGGRPMIEFLFLAATAIFSLWWLARKLRFRVPWQVPLFLCLIMALGAYTAHLSEGFIKEYQRKRIVVFLSPGFDPLGAGYNIAQSEIAIGSGRFFGKGLFSGSQTQLGFLPAKHTDFIFSVIGEELGFVWASVVLGAFALLVWRAFAIGSQTQDRYGALIAAGLGCWFAFQGVLNIGMALGLFPVTGNALPFVSYGGSHIVSSLMAVGLLQSVNFRRYIY